MRNSQINISLILQEDIYDGQYMFLLRNKNTSSVKKNKEMPYLELWKAQTNLTIHTFSAFTTLDSSD